MSAQDPDEGRLLGHNPLLDDDAVLSELFGGRRPAPIPVAARPGQSVPGLDGAVERPRSKPTHYRIVSFSLYIEDIARLDELVRRLKEKGYTKANKSQVIRYALATVDIEKMPILL